MERRNKSLKITPVVRDISESLGKIPPQAIDLEEAVLGALMLESNAIIAVGGLLHPDHFYLESHRVIYEAIRDLFAAGEPIDMKTVVSQLKKNGKLELAEGEVKIANLCANVSSAANIEYHAIIVIEMAMKRSMITLASQIHHDAYEDTVDVFEMIERYNLDMQNILDKAVSSRAEKSMKTLAYDNIQEVQARQSGKHTGIDSGFPALDEALAGFHNTDLIIVAARPGMGKTAFVVQSAKQCAQQGLPAGLFSLEMSAQQLVTRMIISDSEIDADRVQKGKMDGAEFQRYSDNCGRLMGLPLYIDDTPFLSIVDLRARAMRMKAKYGIRILIVDYLQLIRGIGQQNRDQEIGQITRTLKGVAKELDIPVIAISQLNRGVETRGGDKRPLLSDLRESGSIEQDADIVMFLYRPEYYKITVDEYGFPTHGLCEFIIAKHRNGALGTARLKFIGRFTKFVEWNGEYEPIQQTSIKRDNQEEYTKKHYKNPLPSERQDADFADDDTPF